MTITYYLLVQCYLILLNFRSSCPRTVNLSSLLIAGFFCQAKAKLSGTFGLAGISRTRKKSVNIKVTTFWSTRPREFGRYVSTNTLLTIAFFLTHFPMARNALKRTQVTQTNIFNDETQFYSATFCLITSILPPAATTFVFPSV